MPGFFFAYLTGLSVMINSCLQKIILKGTKFLEK